MVNYISFDKLLQTKTDLNWTVQVQTESFKFKINTKRNQSEATTWTPNPWVIGLRISTKKTTDVQPSKLLKVQFLSINILYPCKSRAAHLQNNLGTNHYIPNPNMGRKKVASAVAPLFKSRLKTWVPSSRRQVRRTGSAIHLRLVGVICQPLFPKQVTNIL